MFKRKGFEIIISSDTQYEDLCAEIFIEGEFVAIITQEQGIENAIIEFDPPKKMSKWTFNYLEFFEILKEAYELLVKMKKTLRIWPASQCANCQVKITEKFLPPNKFISRLFSLLSLILL